MANLLEALTPKNILLNTLKDKLGEFGITKLIMYYVIPDEKFNVMLSAGEGNTLKLDINEKELSIVKRLYIRRILTKWEKLYPTQVPHAVIMQIDLSVTEDQIQVFIENVNKQILKFSL